MICIPQQTENAQVHRLHPQLRYYGTTTADDLRIYVCLSAADVMSVPGDPN